MTKSVEIFSAVLFIFCGLLFGADGQCTLPLSDGVWLSSTRGTWTVSGGGFQIADFSAALTVSLTTATLNCTQTGNTDTQYILSTNFEIFRGLFITVYTCLDIIPTEQAPNSYVGYIVTPVDSTTGEKFTSDLASVCSNTGYATPLNVIMILQSGSEANAAANCPDVILGNYSTSYADSDSVVTSDVLMDSCNDTTRMNFDNVTSGANLGFTTGNILQCLYYASSGSNVYVFTYNNDTSVDSSQTYRFGCMVCAYASFGTACTILPNECLQDQSSRSVAYPGQQFDFTPFYVCPLNSSSEEDEGLAGWVIAVIVLSILLVLAIIAAVIIYILLRRKRSNEDEDGILKNDSQENVPKDSDDIARIKRVIKEDEIRQELKRDPKYRLHKKKEDGYDSGFDEKGQIREKLLREQSFELKELKKDKGRKLMASNSKGQSTETVNTAGSERQPPIGKEEPTLLPTPRGKHSTPPTTRKSEKVVEQPIPKEKQISTIVTPKPGKDGKLQPVVQEEPVIIPIPQGKRSIPPTTPKPDKDDTTLARIKKERERKEKERLEKKKQQEAKKGKTKDAKPDVVAVKEKAVIKTKREDSSGEEYETDESEKEERMRKLLEKRKRLQGAAYVPPGGVLDATVVGRKKHRRPGEDEEGGDMTKTLVTREQQEKRDTEKKTRKKALHKLAKRKLHPTIDRSDSSDSDAADPSKKHKRRKGGDPRARGAPFMEQYHTKKELEHELEKMDYWNEAPVKPADSVDLTLDTKPKPVEVVPADQSAEQNTKQDKDTANKERATYEDESMWDKPIPELEIEIQPNGQLPEGYYRDNAGNIVRERDGVIIATADVVKLIEMRKRMNVFGLPRLLRNDDGRPLGGYKDDIFGPTAEWDWGENAEETDDRKSEVPRAPSGRQVGFTMADGSSVAPTPLIEDYNQLKGRQLGPAEMELLQQRLFEKQQKLAANGDGDKRLPVHFLGKRSDAHPESLYIDNCQVQSIQPSQSKGSKSMRASTPGVSTMIMRSDTFDDGRHHSKENKRPQNANLKRNTKFRASWSASDSFVRDGIPEETEMEDVGSAPKDYGKSRNIGSDDEFIVVPTTDSKHHGRPWLPPAREETLMSDMSMMTAPDSIRPFSGDDKRYRKYLGELYKDQKYFEYYLATEKLPTKAGKETRGLATHGLDFLLHRAEYWNEQDPSYPPPSALALRLSRMQTLYTIADSGMDSAVSSELARPNSADDADENITTARLSHRESTRDFTGRGGMLSHRSDLANISRSEVTQERDPPTGRSDAAKTPSKFEKNNTSVTFESELTGDIGKKSGEKKNSPRKPDKKKKSKTEPKTSKDNNVLTLQPLDQDADDMN